MEGIDESTIPALSEGYIDWLLNLQKGDNQLDVQGEPGSCLEESAASAMDGPLEEIDQALDEVLMSIDDEVSPGECLR